MLIIIYYILSEAFYLLLRFICETGPPIFPRLVQILHSIAVLNIIWYSIFPKHMIDHLLSHDRAINYVTDLNYYTKIANL